MVKICFVPTCKNRSSIVDKKFFSVPKNTAKRNIWFSAVGYGSTSKGHAYYCCEDHFHLPEDTRNWMCFRFVEGTVLKLRENVVPHKNIEPQVSSTPLNFLPTSSSMKIPPSIEVSLKSSSTSATQMSPPSKIEELSYLKDYDASPLKSDISPTHNSSSSYKLPNDMENYMEYHVMGSVSQVRMKPGCMPHKFTCQPDKKPRISDTTERPYIVKKRKVMILEECEKEYEEKCIVTEQSGFEEIASGSSGVKVESLENTQQDLPEKIKLECLPSSLHSHKCEELDIHHEHIKLESVKDEPNDSEQLFPCESCEMVFSREKELTEHKIAERDCITLEEDETAWNIEDSSIQDFGVHQPDIKSDVAHEKVQVSKIYQCRACRERCRQKEDLRHHEKIHVHLLDHTYALFPSENSYG
nr:uncharacterized protein LOC111518133 isoform X1 [Leptinotarsa decemlineata]